MTVIERAVCRVNALNSKGLGIGISSTSLETVEVPYTIPGDVIEFEKHSDRNKIFFTLAKIMERSEHRTDPPCKYFAICGGCSLQHLGENYYYQQKSVNLQSILASYSLRLPPLSPIKKIGALTRRRAVFEAIKKRDQIFFGFKKYRSDQIVNIDGCLLLLPELSTLINKLKIILSNFLDDKERCKILVTKADNGIDLIIESACSSVSDDKTENLKNFAINNNIIRLIIISNRPLSSAESTPKLPPIVEFQKKSNDKWNLVYLAERPYITFEQVKVTIDNHSFLQVSSTSDVILAQLINDIIGKITNYHRISRIVDLFCGRGTLTIPATKFGQVDGFESEKSAVKALTEAIKLAKINATIYQRDLFTMPLKWDELNKYDIAIINPPRAGSQKQTQSLATSTVKTIIYLSCNPESFGRDAKILLHNNRYNLAEVTPIDQFYWSHHIELVGVFTKAEDTVKLINYV